MREHIVYQLLDRDNWEVIDQIDSFLYVFDKMPQRMRMVVDLKMTGNTNEEIAEMMKTTLITVRRQLSMAKNRIIKALY